MSKELEIDKLVTDVRDWVTHPVTWLVFSTLVIAHHLNEARNILVDVLGAWSKGDSA